jgi:DNA excision repair protein ERCC-3
MQTIFVPTNTLKEQWHEYIAQNIPERRHEIDVFTYSANRRLWEDTTYTLVAFDECQYLPADTFARLAFLKTKYRIGLSASPHREDGRESYVIALTGFPVGLNWQEYMKETGRSYHPIHVHIVRSGKEAKLRKLRELLNPNKRTMIFCDSIELGKEIGRTFDVPYIHGETQNRLDTIRDNKVIAMSRVGDVGVSVKDLEQIIEVDFLYGSRQQQLQRTGRLMHSEEAERHDIIMTEQEIKDYGKRIWALQEKGFTIKIHE